MKWGEELDEGRVDEAKPVEVKPKPPQKYPSIDPMSWTKASGIPESVMSKRVHATAYHSKLKQPKDKVVFNATAKGNACEHARSKTQKWKHAVL